MRVLNLAGAAPFQLRILCLVPSIFHLRDVRYDRLGISGRGSQQGHKLGEFWPVPQVPDESRTIYGQL